MSTPLRSWARREGEKCRRCSQSAPRTLLSPPLKCLRTATGATAMPPPSSTPPSESARARQMAPAHSRWAATPLRKVANRTCMPSRAPAAAGAVNDRGSRREHPPAHYKWGPVQGSRGQKPRRYRRPHPRLPYPSPTPPPRPAAAKGWSPENEEHAGCGASARPPSSVGAALATCQPAKPPRRRADPRQTPRTATTGRPAARTRGAAPPSAICASAAWRRTPSAHPLSLAAPPPTRSGSAMRIQRAVLLDACVGYCAICLSGAPLLALTCPLPRFCGDGRRRGRGNLF